MRGWVYVMTCRAMPGLLKVGASAKDPFLRAKELRSTGNPHEFVVEYDTLVEDPFMLERAVHERLAHHQEIGDGRGVEFFRCTVEEVVMVIRALTKNSGATDAFHKVQRDEILAAEKAKAERLEELRREAADELKRQQDEAIIRAAKERAFRLQEEQVQEGLRLAQERIEQRQAWDSDQEKRLYMSFKDKRVRAKGLEMLAAGTLVMCTNCGRPLLSPSPIVGGIECDACRTYVAIPRK